MEARKSKIKVPAGSVSNKSPFLTNGIYCVSSCQISEQAATLEDRNSNYFLKASLLYFVILIYF